MNESDLKEFEDFFFQRGRFANWLLAGGPFHTYPNGQPEHQYKHEICVELARRGKLVEMIHEEGHSCWEPAMPHS